MPKLFTTLGIDPELRYNAEMQKKNKSSLIHGAALLAGGIATFIAPLNKVYAFQLNTCWSGIACMDPGTLFVNMNNSFFFIAGLIAMSIFLVGTFRMVISAGNDSELQAAKGMMKGALIGIAIVSGSYGIYRTIVFWLYP